VSSWWWRWRVSPLWLGESKRERQRQKWRRLWRRGALEALLDLTGGPTVGVRMPWPVAGQPTSSAALHSELDDAD
jgi:hypothetical protein